MPILVHTEFAQASKLHEVDDPKGKNEERAVVLYRDKMVPKIYTENFFRRASIWVHTPSFSSLSPAVRLGGVGPHNMIEISPWVASTKIFNKLPLGKHFEFVYDSHSGVCYIDQLPLAKRLSGRRSSGHCSLATCGKLSLPVGGEIWRVGMNKFRSNESSGHYGKNWTDEIRFHFIESLAIKGASILHEPWKIEAFSPDALEDEELEFYQDNFLRRFGNSILNPSAFFCIFTCTASLHAAEKYRKSPYYEEISYGDTERACFSLKKEFRGLKKLDLKFMLDGKLVPHDEVNKTLVSYFRDKYK